ncbi:hypothetical protein [Kribbella sp. NPDC006257]
MTTNDERGPEFEDQDSEPTMTAPGEGRPDGTAAPVRDEDDDEDGEAP